jgi:hypothetical protein
MIDDEIIYYGTTVNNLDHSIMIVQHRMSNLHKFFQVD